MRAEPVTLDLPQGTLAGQAWGPATAPPVLALHGWQDSSASFAPLAAHLGDVRLVALDLAGHGRSAWRPAGVAYEFLDWVVDVRDALEALGWSRCAVLGHSLGAGIGVAIAATWPERVSRLALLDGLAPRTQEPSELPARLAEYVAGRDAARARRPRVLADAAAAARRLAEVLGVGEAAARVLAERATVPVEGGARWARDPRIAVGPKARLAEAQVAALLRGVRCPVLLLRPSRGWPLPEAKMAAALAMIEDIEVLALEGGHHVHLEEPARVAESLRGFLAADRP